MSEKIGNTLNHLDDVTSKKFGNLEIYTVKSDNKNNNSQPIFSRWFEVDGAR